MAPSPNYLLKVYEPDPEDPKNRWVETTESLNAPLFCQLYSHCLALLVDHDDPTILDSFNDMVKGNWPRVKTHLPPLVALTRASDPRNEGREMALCHRGIGPTNTMLFFDYELVDIFEDATDKYTQDLLAFVCIVTTLHEFRHWVRGVIKGMHDASTGEELHMDWGKTATSPGESGYVGEHRLWGGVMVAGFGYDGRNDRIKFRTVAQSGFSWRHIKAVGITKGPQGNLKKLFVYKWLYVQQVVERMRSNMPFMAPDPVKSLASLDRAAYTPSELHDKMDLGAEISAKALDLPSAPPPPARPFTFHATAAKYYPMLLVDRPEADSPNANARKIPGRIKLPVRDRVKRFLAHVFKRDKHKMVFMPFSCNDDRAA